MTRLYILVEGQTEEKFVKDLLAPHLQRLSVWSTPIIVATRRDKHTGKKSRGGGHWKHWAKDLHRLIKVHPGKEVRFTTLFDLYGLPDDFPEIEKYGQDPDTVRRADSLEQAMARAINDWRLIPYLQRHEFEALVLACLSSLTGLLDPDDRVGAGKLSSSLGTLEPESINDGKETAPSKRLESHIEGYIKTVHGPLAIEAAGLGAIREKCPRFSAWLSKLEALSGQNS